MLQNIFNNFFKKKNVSSQEVFPNWNNDQFESVVTQRNILLVITLVCILLIILSIIAVSKISASKTFEPFVIQIEETTGMTKVVKEANQQRLNSDEALARYFIKKYLVARETYNPVDFELNKKVISLFSTSKIYSDYKGYIKNPLNDPTIIYGQKNTTYLKIKSFTRLNDKYFVRFAIFQTSGDPKPADKIATLAINYVSSTLSEEDRDINPIGFQITGYRVDDDQS